jgi:hypothetical protein
MLEVALNCQLPAMFGVEGVPDGCPGEGVEGEFAEFREFDAPHPERRTATERARMVAKRLMSYLPKES